MQFYETDDFLYAVVSEFIAAGLSANQPVIVIATPPHVDGFTAALRAKGVAVDEASTRGDVVFIDARQTIEKYMDGGTVDTDKFMRIVGNLLDVASRRGTTIRAYGEMVDLLWRDGKPDAALEVEHLWNDLAELYTFQLLCAYPMANFDDANDRAKFEAICAAHSFVVPAEAFRHDANLSRQIAVLQQRSAALETEVVRREQLERTLRDALNARAKAEHDLEDFIENATIGLHCVGRNGTILWANRAELDLLGYSKDEYVGHHITEFHADAGVIADILKRLRSNEAIRDYEARLRAKDGSIKTVAITSNALFEDGKFVHTRCFTRDITDRKRLEEEQRRTHEDNAFLLHAATSLIRAFEFDSRLAEVARLAVPRLADWCAAEVASDDSGMHRRAAAHIDDLIEDSVVGLHDAVATVLTSGKPQILDSLEDAIVASSAVASALILPMNIADRTVGAVTFVRVGAGRAYSKEDIALATEFVRRAAVAIENAKLYRLAQEANRIKDQFLATLSHELRTPLTAILGWARMLTLDGLDPEMIHTACTTIERSARAQATIIDDLLDLSTIVTGKLSLRNEPTDVMTVIDGAIDTVRLAAESRAIRIDVAPPAEPLIIDGDPTRLQQIVWNLVSNAIKFSPRGGSVLVAVEPRRDTARIIVRDEGKGISARFLPHVFDPFRQADSHITREHGGLGLGLAIVKYLTELHGGSVTASSAGEGKGATFIVTLPLTNRRASDAQQPEPQLTADLRGTNVLVVDGDGDTRMLVNTILRRAGAKIVDTETAGEAENALGVTAIDVVVAAVPLRVPRDIAHIRLADVDEKIDGSEGAVVVRKPIDPIELTRIIERVRAAH